MEFFAVVEREPVRVDETAAGWAAWMVAGSVDPMVDMSVA